MTCERHGTVMRGVIACVHVVRGAPVAHYLPPTAPGPGGSGELLCAECHESEEVAVDNLLLICEQCAETVRATVH